MSEYGDRTKGRNERSWSNLMPSNRDKFTESGCVWSRPSVRGDECPFGTICEGQLGQSVGRRVPLCMFQSRISGVLYCD